jgi:trigger factor
MRRRACRIPANEQTKMQVTETLADGLKREFKVVVPAADIERKLSERLTRLAASARLPGFRPGKVPTSLLKKRYGSSVMGEVLEQAVSDSSAETIRSRGLRPAMQPKVSIAKFAEGEDLEYTMAMELLPDIEPVDFSALELERLSVEVPESEIEEALKGMAARQRRSEPIAEPRQARERDILVIDFVGRLGETEFQGGSAQDYHLELGGGSFIPGFEDQLVGAMPGEERKVVVTFPADYGNKDLAGKEANFAVTVKEIREPVETPIDDELAKAVGLENLESLRRQLGEQIQGEYRGLARVRLKRALLDALSDRHHFPVPAGMVESEFEEIWRQIEADRKEGRLDPEDAAKSEEDLRRDYMAIAERRVRLGLLLSEVGRANNIQVTAEELNRAVLDEARRFPGRERQVFEFYQKNPEMVARLRAPIYEDKIIDFILELAKLTDRKVTPQELNDEFKAAAAKD